MACPDLLLSTSALQDHEKQYVGFATLPNQVHRKSVKKGFDFTLMVAGESAHGWRLLGHTVGERSGPALTSLRYSLSSWILPSHCSGPCLRPCFAPQPMLSSDSFPRRNGPLLTTPACFSNRVAGLGGEGRASQGPRERKERESGGAERSHFYKD